jgi:hypothetical protein
MAFLGFGAPPLPSRHGPKKRPLRCGHRRGRSFVVDQYPRGALGDETMTTTAEETAARAADEALRLRDIEGQRKIALFPPVKPPEGVRRGSPLE